MTNIRINIEREKAKNECLVDQIVIDSKCLQGQGQNCKICKIDL